MWRSIHRHCCSRPPKTPELDAKRRDRCQWLLLRKQTAQRRVIFVFVCSSYSLCWIIERWANLLSSVTFVVIESPYFLWYRQWWYKQKNAHTANDFCAMLMLNANAKLRACTSSRAICMGPSDIASPCFCGHCHDHLGTPSAELCRYNQTWYINGLFILSVCCCCVLCSWVLWRLVVVGASGAVRSPEFPLDLLLIAYCARPPTPLHYTSQKINLQTTNIPIIKSFVIVAYYLTVHYAFQTYALRVVFNIEFHDMTLNFRVA
jgi:hypothetical protein